MFLMARGCVFMFMCFGFLASASAQLSYTNATLPTELVTKSVDIEATGSKAIVQQLKFRTISTADAAAAAAAGKQEKLPSMSCTIVGGNTGTRFQWSWANGSAISEEHGAKASRVPKTGTLDTMRVVGKLTFTSFAVNGGLNVGNYKCTADGQVANPSVLSAPIVSLGEREYRSDLEGEPMEQYCSIIAYPPPTITWTKNNQTLLVASERIKFSSDNRTMSITEVQKSDAGVYICTATNRLGVGQAYVKIRVKDRLAALYPFLGILAEVIVLVIIIFMYEKNRAAKKRSQQEEEEEEGEGADAATSRGGAGAAKGIGGGGGGGRNANDSDVRQRPNVRA